MQAQLAPQEMFRFFACRFEQERLFEGLAAASGSGVMSAHALGGGHDGGGGGNAVDLTQAMQPH